MAATRQDLQDWFLEGIKEDCRYMVIVCDTFDYEDYPVGFHEEQSVREFLANPGEMQRVMEIYDLEADMETQLNLHRAWAITP